MLASVDAKERKSFLPEIQSMLENKEASKEKIQRELLLEKRRSKRNGCYVGVEQESNDATHSA